MNKILFIALISILPIVSKAQTTNYKAYALFVYNFTKYTNWSPEANKGDVFITVIGNSGITESLNELAKSKTLNGRKYSIQQVGSSEEVPLNSHLIFIPALKSGSLKALVEKFNGKNALIVTEQEGLISKGAHISFVVLEDGSLKFQLNPEALEKNRLQLSSALKTLALKN